MDKKNVFSKWFKKFGAYCIAGGVVIAMAVTILVTSSVTTTDSNQSIAQNPVVSVSTEPLSILTFALPMTDGIVTKNFSNSELYFNNTLDRWEFHNGIDMTSSDLKVFAVADGTVADIYNDYSNGTVVVVDHGNNLQSVYASLNEDVLVAIGDKVKKSEQIGTADDTAGNESEDGAHLHFMFLENENQVDPANYLDLENK